MPGDSSLFGWRVGCRRVAAAAVVGGAFSPVPAAVIYGGPTFDGPSNSGYVNPTLAMLPGATAGTGTGVGSADRQSGGQSVGTRAFRWNADGAAATELGNLGTGGGSAHSEAYAVNAAGTAVGSAEKYTGGTNVGSRAVRWAAGGVAATELGNLGTGSGGTTTAAAHAVNAAGTAVGFAYKYTGGTDVGARAVRWADGGTAATELGNLGTNGSGFTYSIAYAVNAAGAAVGYAEKYAGGADVGTRGVRWAAGGTAATELDSLGTSNGGFTRVVAHAVNADGTAVGSATKYTGGTSVGTRAVRWDGGGTAATELGNLGTGGGGTTTTAANAANGAGTAVGSAIKYVDGRSAGTRAVRWAAGGTAATELGNFGVDINGITVSEAFAVNAAGVVAGSVYSYAAGSHAGGAYDGFRAVYWGADGVPVDVNTLLSPSDAALWTLTRAVSISDANWMTGYATYDPDGTGPRASYTRAFLIQVPEPAGSAVVAAGTAGLCLCRRRRRDGRANERGGGSLGRRDRVPAFREREPARLP